MGAVLKLKKVTAPRFSSDVGSNLTLSPQDERDLAFLCNPAMHHSYDPKSGWWTITLLVSSQDGKLRRPKFIGKGRGFCAAVSAALARWRRNEPG